MNPKPPPQQFTVGYLGSYGADKGVRYLLEAWKKLNYEDARLVLGGRDSVSQWVNGLIGKYGGGAIEQLGWVKDVSEFYGKISLYVQPSATEGFGIEVLEAQAHGRPVLCSEGAGACDTVFQRYRFPACDSQSLAERIDQFKVVWDRHSDPSVLESWRDAAKSYDWKLIRQKYQALYAELLGG